MVDMLEKPTVDLEGVVLVGRGEAGRSEYGGGELEVLRLAGMGIRDISHLFPTCSELKLWAESRPMDRTIRFRFEPSFLIGW